MLQRLAELEAKSNWQSCCSMRLVRRADINAFQRIITADLLSIILSGKTAISLTTIPVRTGGRVFSRNRDINRISK